MLGTRSGCPQELVLNEESLDFPVSDLQTARSEIFNLPVTAFYFLCGKQSENSSGYFLFSHTHTHTLSHTDTPLTSGIPASNSKQITP